MRILIINSAFTLLPLLLLLLLHSAISASGYGSMGPISAAYGDSGFFCAIDASGKQEVICWGKNSSSLSQPSPSNLEFSAFFGEIPAMAALSGGEGFLCGILSNTSQAFCWTSAGATTGTDLVPFNYRTTAYSYIAAGKDHVCAIRGAYYSDHDSGIVDCWNIEIGSNNSLRSRQSSQYYDQSISNLVFKMVVSGEGFSCGGIREGGIVCWGPNSQALGISNVSESFASLVSGRDSVCGISNSSTLVKCWGNNDSFPAPPTGIGFVSLTAGAHHFCGIRKDNHGVECWGNSNFSSVPKGSGFVAIASSDFTSCGIREDDLVLDCWFTDGSVPSDYNPPLELCSPGLCNPGSCGENQYAFNASILNEPDLTSLCIRKDLKICSSCGLNCSEGFFLSSSCTANADRVCTACSLCQSDSCWDVCKLKSSPVRYWYHWRRLIIIIGSSVLAVLLILLLGCCLLPRMCFTKKEEGSKKQFKKPESGLDAPPDSIPCVSVAPCPGTAQIFRLSELKDATNGFKEFNELGRGSYGFVYKAVLTDGRQVAVKRANAATIIHTNSREFEMELEILCSVRHSNIVNLLGYCSEMGERLLVYEYMPRGTLHDHLHGGLSPLNWNLRLQISMHAAKGLEYLHKEVVPPVVHGDVKSSNILLDSEWGARIADFGLIAPSERDINGDIKKDVFGFGIVLLELLSGRKSYDIDYTPPGIVEWAVPLIRKGKAAAIIDRNVALPRNVEPLLKLADIAELAVRENHEERPSMSDVASSLQQLAKDGFILQ